MRGTTLLAECVQAPTRMWLQREGGSWPFIQGRSLLAGPASPELSFFPPTLQSPGQVPCLQRAWTWS